MKLFSGIFTLVLALIISSVAAFFSVDGLGALFAAAYIPVVIMGTALEAGKLVATTWLKFNWSNPRVSRLHKTYLTVAVGVLMVITALGIYGFLAKGHLEQEAPLASVEIQISQIEQKINQTKDDSGRLTLRLNQLDQSVNTILSTSKNTRDAQAALKARQQQQKERDDINKQITAKNEELNGLTSQLIPLKTKVADVGAKLGPIKYIANLFGWSDTNSAVQLVILMIMFAFDPLAVVLVLSGAITISEWYEERKKNPLHLSLNEPPVVPREIVLEAPRGSVHESEKNLTVRSSSHRDLSSVVLEQTPEESAIEQIIEDNSDVTKTDKEALIEILERNPELFQMFIEETTPQTEVNTGVENSESDAVSSTEGSHFRGFAAWANDLRK